MTSTTARTPCVAQTPDVITYDNDIQLTRFDAALSETTPTSRGVGVFNGDEDVQPVRSRWRAFSKRCREIFNNNTGLLLIATAQLFKSTMALFVKKLNSVDPPVPTLELICVRLAITWIFCVTYMKLRDVPDPFLGPKGIRLLLAFRGFCGFIGLFGSYYSLQYLTLSDATVLQFLAPMCTAVVGALVLKEDFKGSQAIASLCSLCGVVLIARPTFLFGSRAKGTVANLDDSRSDIATELEGVIPTQRLQAVGFALLGVLGSTGAYTTIRAIGKRVHPLQSVVAFSTQCVIASSIAMLIFHTPVILLTRLDWIVMLFAIGCMGFGGQMLMTMGLQRETAGRGTMAVYVQIIFATFNDFIFFHSIPTVLSIIGTIIIIGSAIYVALSKENPRLHKRNASLIAPSRELVLEDSLEEGLLENQDEEEESTEVTKKNSVGVTQEDVKGDTS